MLEVADTGNDVVMLFGGDYDRERTDGPDQVRVTPDLFGVGFPVCRNKIVRVFQQVIRGAGETCFLCTCHRMAADEILCQAGPYRSVGRLAFNGAHVGQYAVFPDDGSEKRNQRSDGREREESAVLSSSKSSYLMAVIFYHKCIEKAVSAVL